MTRTRPVHLEQWSGPWADDDPDANFKHDVALYSRLDPLETIGVLSSSTGIPEGAICRYILGKWAAAGSEALMTLGPTAVVRMCELVTVAEESGTDEARLAAYRDVVEQLRWLCVPLDPGKPQESR